MNANKLSVNPDKTEYLLITSNKLLLKPPLMLQASTTVSPSDHVKNLGVLFQSDLSLNDHISAIRPIKSCYHHIRDIRRIRSSLTKQSALILANALVHSRLDYCNSLLFGLPKKSIQRLQKVQNCLARIVSGASFRDHTTPILKSLHWLPIPSRIDFKICLLTHRIISTKQPSYLASLLSERKNCRNVRSSSFDPLNIQYFKHVTMGYRSFSYAAPHLWNSLPETIRSTSDHSSFRSQLKTHFFRRAFKFKT